MKKMESEKGQRGRQRKGEREGEGSWKGESERVPFHCMMQAPLIFPHYITLGQIIGENCTENMCS